MNREEYASIKINYLRELQKIPFIKEAFDFFTLEGIVDTIECNYDNKFYDNKKVLLDSIYQYYFAYFDNYLNNIAIIIKLFDEKDMSSDLSNLYKLYLSYIEIEREKENEDKIIYYISLEKMIDYKFSKKLSTKIKDGDYLWWNWVNRLHPIIKKDSLWSQDMRLVSIIQ